MGYHDPCRFHNLLEWLIELTKAVYLCLQFSYKAYTSGPAKWRAPQPMESLRGSWARSPVLSPWKLEDLFLTPFQPTSSPSLAVQSFYWGFTTWFIELISGAVPLPWGQTDITCSKPNPLITWLVFLMTGLQSESFH